ncbi:MAG: GFA family protein [Nitratireductor sp.]
MDETIHKGSCLCGAVRYSTRGDLRPVTYCHCSQCRKQTGLYYATTAVADGDLSVEGAEHVTWYHASSHAKRGFCGTCGSALFWKMDSAPHTAILAGSLDGKTAQGRTAYLLCRHGRLLHAE